MNKRLQRRNRQVKPEELAALEVERLLEVLPPELRVRARGIPVTFELEPTPAMVADHIAPDTLGLFVGDEYAHSWSGGEALPTQIILFIGNLWDFAEADEKHFCREVRKTVLHELGHFLGLDEADLEARHLA
ncbi:MAG: metallopeptidase family protein [Kiritimatiellaeota bacterium]|nr:metallopeptidase family protein [Kiritimatiellota bacterium]